MNQQTVNLRNVTSAWKIQIKLNKFLRREKEIFYNNCIPQDHRLVVSGLTVQFISAPKINNIFQMLCKYLDLNEEKISKTCKNMVSMFLLNEMFEEIINLKCIHEANFASSRLNPKNYLIQLS